MLTDNQSNILRAAISLVLAGLLAYGLYMVFLPFLVPVLLGATIAFLSHRFYDSINQKVGIPVLSAFITILILILCIAVPLFFIANVLVQELITISNSFSYHTLSVSSVNVYINNIADKLGYSGYIDIREYLIQIANYLSQNSGTIVSGFFSTIATAFIATVTAIYTLVNHDQVKETLIQYSPFNEKDTTTIWKRGSAVIKATVNGNIILITLQMIVAMIGYSIAGIGSPVLIGALHGLATIIPGIGATLVWVPTAIFLLVTKSYVGVGIVIIWSLLQTALLDNFVGPKLIEKKAGLHPFFVLMGVLGGVAQFGPLGIVVGPTIVALGFVGIEILYRSYNDDPND